MKIEKLIKNLPTKLVLNIIFKKLKEDEVLTSKEVLEKALILNPQITMGGVQRQLKKFPRYSYGGVVYYGNKKNIEALKKHIQKKEDKCLR